MRTLLLVPLCLLLAAAASAGVMYKWTDKNGVVHYSDRPVPGAVRVEMPSIPASSAPPRPTTGQSSSGATTTAPDSSYTRFELWSPAQDETIRGTGNTVTVRLRLEPRLRPGHSIWIYLDGKRVDGLAQTGENFELREVTRGSHSVTAVISDGEGKALERTEAVTFHLQQVGLNTPGSQVNKAKPPGAGK